MKSFLYLEFLLCSLSCFGLEKELEREESFVLNNYEENSHGYFGNDDFDNRTYYEGEYVGNPDFDAEIERPCLVYDLNCIRKYFAEHSKCKIRRGPLPRNLFIDQESTYLSASNISTTTGSTTMAGFRRARIEEFYINRRTNRMVFSINIRGYIIIYPTGYFQFYRKGREPIVAVTDVDAIYESLTFTAVIPYSSNEILLHDLEATTYADDVPAFYINPTLLDDGGPAVSQHLADFFADIPTVIQELMLTETQFYVPAYIQYNICDFGLKVAPVDYNDDNINNTRLIDNHHVS